MKLIKAPPPTEKSITDADVRRALERGRRRKGNGVHAFTLRCELPTGDADPADYIEALAVAGCTDATIGLGRRGHIALVFAREARSYSDAIASAIRDVTAAIHGVRLIEIVEMDAP